MRFPNNMFIHGLLALAAAVVIFLPASQMPIIGMPFILLFPDLVLVGLAMVIAGAIPAPRNVKISAVFLLWVLGSVGIEAVRLPVAMSKDGVYEAQVVIHQPAKLAVGDRVSLSGDVNPIVTAEGPPGLVKLDVNYGLGMLLSAGTPLVDNMTFTDIADLVFIHGLTPEIGGNAFPRIEVRKDHFPGWMTVTVAVKATADTVLSEFRRTVPLPVVHPAPLPSAFERMVLSIMNDNLIRSLSGLNRRASLTTELSRFIEKSFGLERAYENKGRAIRMTVLRETTEPLPPGTYLPEFLQRFRGDVRYDGRSSSMQACGMSVFTRVFGRSGGRPHVRVLDPRPMESPLILGDQDVSTLYEFYCDEEAGTLVRFTIFGHGQALKMSRYSKQGTLLEVKYLRLPFWPAQMSVIDAGSLKTGADGRLHVSFSTPVWRGPDGKVDDTAPDGKIDDTVFRRVEFVNED
jgi:hypothetical protein